MHLAPCSTQNYGKGKVKFTL